MYFEQKTWYTTHPSSNLGWIFPSPHPFVAKLAIGLTHTAFNVKYDTLMNRKWPYTPSDYIPTDGVS